MSDQLDDRDPFDGQLRQRLERLSAAIPVHPDPIARAAMRRSSARRRTLRVSLLVGATLILFSLGAAAAWVWIGRPMASSSAFAAGGPLHCSGIDALPPREAGAWLEAHGMLAHWQVEDRTAETSVSQDAPPDRGAIVDALALADGHLLVLVDVDRPVPATPRSC